MQLEIVMEQWIPEIISAVAGFLGGISIGSLVTIKFINSSNIDKRNIKQNNITAGRDNIGGDQIRH